MEAKEHIDRWTKLIEDNYIMQLHKAKAEGERFLVIDFNLLMKRDPDIAELVIDEPYNSFKAAEYAVESFEGFDKYKPFSIRIKGVSSTRIPIRDIRSEHIGRLIQVQGIVRQKSDVRPLAKMIRFECNYCGTLMTVIQDEKVVRYPGKCTCKKTGFRILERVNVDSQGLVIEESPDELDGGQQPKRINIFMEKDLVRPMEDMKTSPGMKVKVWGVIKEVPVFIGTARATRSDIILDANYIEAMEEDFGQLDISKEDEKEITKIAMRPDPLKELAGSFAPMIHGHDQIKEAILLQLFGGVRKVNEGNARRGDIHVLLVGDPGIAKSQMVKRAVHVSPKARYVSGKGASGAGLTATVMKDEFNKGWALEAGALVMANNGFCGVDEFDKIKEEDISNMHEAMEQQTVTVTKANIQATLSAITTVLAAANPKHQRFDIYEPIAKQIDLPATIINRFDLIFPIQDRPDAEDDSTLADFIIKRDRDGTKETGQIPTDIIRKYLAYARQRISPVITNDAYDSLKDFYVKVRSSGISQDKQKPIPISPRQFEALIRLTEASAKSRLSNTAEKQDADKAISLLQYCLSRVGIDPDTGELDIDRIEGGESMSNKKKIRLLKDLIIELDTESSGPIQEEILAARAKSHGIEGDSFDELIDKMKLMGELIEPRRGEFIRHFR